MNFNPEERKSKSKPESWDAGRLESLDASGLFDFAVCSLSGFLAL
jgi:hypothetical protein